MIKFIASDMDGTLLDSRKQLPPDFEDVLKALNERGVIFAVSSGRQYETLRAEFEHISGDMMIIAENGAIVFNGNKNIICNTLECEQYEKILSVLEKQPDIYPVISGVDSAYGTEKNRDVLSHVSMYYKKYKSVDNLRDIVKYDKVLKAAIFDPVGAEERTYPLMSGISDDMEALLSGDEWVDVMKKGISKGSAIKKIQELYGIKPEECMAFGDYLNDCEMMKACGETYAMANAHPDLKKLCKYSCKSNDDYGVTDKIKEIFGI